MRPAAVGPASNRRVLGSMNECAIHLGCHTERSGDPLVLALGLSDIPMSAVGAKSQYGIPRNEARELLIGLATESVRYCQIRGSEGIGGDEKINVFSKLLILKMRRPGSNPSLSVSLFLFGLMGCRSSKLARASRCCRHYRCSPLAEAICSTKPVRGRTARVPAAADSDFAPGRHPWCVTATTCRRRQTLSWASCRPARTCAVVTANHRSLVHP